jgi:peptide/nickel transport system substrate-binding protein
MTKWRALRPNANCAVKRHSEEAIAMRKSSCSRAIFVWRSAILAISLLSFVTAARPSAAKAERLQGISMVGAPALPKGFEHFPYVDPKAPKGGRVRIGMLGAFESLNRFNMKALRSPLFLVGAVYESLMVRSQDETKSYYGLIAQSVEMDDSREHVTFHLDPRARFSDKRPVSSQDVQFTFELLKSSGPPSMREALSLVKAVDAPDDHTIHFDLSGSNDRELPLTLAAMPVLAKHATDVAHFDEATLTPPIASGPYVVSEVKPGEQLVLRRDPDYWGKDLPTRRGHFNFDEVNIAYYRDAESLFEAFKGGLVDFREETSAARWKSAYDFPALRSGEIVKESLKPTRPIGMEGFVFNSRKEFFRDVRVREAIGMMLDFEWINANLYGGLYRRTKSYFDESVFSSVGRPASAAERALLEPFPGAVRDDILEGRWLPTEHSGAGRDRDIARKSQALLVSAGYKSSEAGLTKDGKPFGFEIMVRSREEEKVALNFAQSLQKIGVDAQVRLYEETHYNRRRQQFEFDMIVGQWLTVAEPGGEQRTRWGSQSAVRAGSTNLAGAASPAIDAMIDAVVSAHDEAALVAAARALDRVLLSGFYITPLHHATESWIAHSTKISRPPLMPRYPLLPFNMILETWWRGGEK